MPRFSAITLLIAGVLTLAGAGQGSGPVPAKSSAPDASPASAQPQTSAAPATAEPPSPAAPAAPKPPGSKASAPSPAAIAEARAALRQAVIFHRQAKDLALKFRAEVYNADLDKRDAYQGRLLLKDSTRFRLEIPGGTYVSDGKAFYEYHARTKQAVIRSAADKEGFVPADVLLRFLDAEPLSVAPVKEGGKEYLDLRLDPSRAMKSLDSLTVLLARKDHSLHRIVSLDASGNEARYTLLSVKRNGGVKDKEFEFTPPKGTEVVDMR